MKKGSKQMLSNTCSSRPALGRFTQRWRIADFKSLVDLSDPADTYESCRFSHPSLKDLTWCLMFYPNPDCTVGGSYGRSYFKLCSHNRTNAPTPVAVCYQIAVVHDDNMSRSFCFPVSGKSCISAGEATSWGGHKNIPAKVHRDDGALVVDCIVDATVPNNKVGIDAAQGTAVELGQFVPDFACILSAVVSTCQEWQISDVETCMNSSQPGDKIEGEEFAHPSMEGASWCLNLFPSGKDDETKGNISLFLHLKTERQSLRVTARYQFFAVFENGEQQKLMNNVAVDEFGSDDDGETFGITGIAKCSSSHLRKDGSMLLKCELSTLIHDPGAAESISVLPSLLAPCDQEKKVYQRLSDCMAKMVHSGYASDFAIKVDSTEIPVHKAVLGCRSKVFKAMFDSCMEEAISCELKILDFSAEAVLQMVRYIYVGRLPRDRLECDLKELVGLADKYELNDLKEICEQKICHYLVLENVVDAILMADKYNLLLLESACLRFFLPSTRDQIFQSEAWKMLKANNPDVAVKTLENACRRPTRAVSGILGKRYLPHKSAAAKKLPRVGT